ncbi:MAG: hydroxyacid dehydrogenase [Anaerolineae bacterium]|nr:hydroxyacid dehydrogenase [Anaerolineae bacterium]
MKKPAAKPRLWIEFPLPARHLAALEGVVDIADGGDLRKLPGSLVAICIPGLAIDADFMDRVGPALQLLAMPGIGLDHIDLAAASQRGILVCNNPDGPSESTAEHAVGLLLTLAKRIVKGDAQLRRNEVDRNALTGTELLGRRLGVVGYGRIGRRVAEICASGLKMSVLVFARAPGSRQPVAPGVTFTDDLDALFTHADVVTLHLPHTPETQHLVRERHLRLMKPGAYLINTSRGQVIEEAALIRVLQDGHLAGAGLDVFDPDPPAPDNPLLRMSNVVVTPHIAPFTDEAFEAMWGGVALQIGQLLRGEPPANLANPEAWPGRAAQN